MLVPVVWSCVGRNGADWRTIMIPIALNAAGRKQKCRYLAGQEPGQQRDGEFAETMLGARGRRGRKKLELEALWWWRWGCVSSSAPLLSQGCPVWRSTG